MTNAPRPPRISEIVSQRLDAPYKRVSSPAIKFIAQLMIKGLMAQRLNEFEAEALALKVAGKGLSLSNPIWRALMADFKDTMRHIRPVLEAAASDVQIVGIQAAATLTRQLAFGGLSEAAIAASGVTWNSPALDTIAQIVNYTNKPAWTAALDAYETGIASTVQQIAVRGVAEGRNPVAIARDVRFAVQGLPAHQANTMLRTLQLTAYRDADVANRVANADILSHHIRIATLDDRTCAACLVLHGTVMELDERVDGHHNCRCTSIPVLRGSERTVRSGEDWFREQSPERQQQQMGGAAYRAWQAGEIQLSDFPRPYTDPTFGGMIREASLKDMLGERAKDFYAKREAA